MSVTACAIPSFSLLDRRLIDGASFHDSYRAPLSHEEAGVVDIFFAVFGHHPVWMKTVLVLRNSLAKACGLEVPTRAEIMAPQARTASYRVGEKIGPWPVFQLTGNELVAGRDNTHMDFRLSICKEITGSSASVVVTTICTTHNAFGRLYLALVIPFHERGVRWLMQRAIAEGRL